MKIYLDHCAYNRPFDDQSNIKIQLETSAKLYIQDQIKQGKYDLVWSYMSDFENNNNPNIENKKSIQLWEDIAKYKCKSSENIIQLILYGKWRNVMMRTETVLKIEAIDLLLKTFGVLETERFITSIKSNNFDYTEWHKNLWKDKSVEEIHRMATEFEKNK